MKIKHFQGYGCVNAVKKSIRDNKDGTKTATIEVSGNHECGIERNDKYDVFRWLFNSGKRFDTSLTDYKQIKNLDIQYLGHINGIETCRYVVTYQTA